MSSSSHFAVLHLFTPCAERHAEDWRVVPGVDATQFQICTETKPVYNSKTKTDNAYEALSGHHWNFGPDHFKYSRKNSLMISRVQRIGRSESYLVWLEQTLTPRRREKQCMTLQV